MAVNLSLPELGVKHGTDKVEHGYLPWYQRELAEIPIQRLLEIGVWHGQSIATWAEWLPDAHIVGLDIDPGARWPDLPNVEKVVGDAKTYQPSEPFDVVIDDGSHTVGDVMATFFQLWPHIAPGGVYVIEDLATQFDPVWGGTLDGSPVTAFIAELALVLASDRAPAREAASHIHVYPQIAFLHKSGG